MSEADKSQIAYEILAYLAKNPDAQDTVDGIVEWWLLAQHIERQIARVKEALDELVRRELIVVRRGKDSRIYYRLNQRKAKGISKLLREMSDGQGVDAVRGTKDKGS